MRLAPAAALLLTSLLVSPAVLLAAATPPASSVTPASVPAAGRHEALVKVDAFGRWAVTVGSRQGVALQLVDRMAGPGEVRGSAGEQDGRIDAFLDRGEYKVVVTGHERASGDAKLELHAFTELSAPKPAMLVEHKPVTATLADFQQVSWWLHVTERRQVLLEVAGRHLAELKLWQDGTWAVDADGACEVVEPVRGKPLNTCRLWPTLEPGLYLLSAYGGPGVPWAAGGDERPLYLRYGIPRLPEAGRRAYVVGPFGTERYLLPGSATFFRLELPEARPAEMDVVSLDGSEPYQRGGSAAVIDKKSLPPVAEVRLGESEKERVVTIVADAGQPYVLQHFKVAWSYPFEGSGEHFVASLHSGTPVDSIDATALVTRYCPGQSTSREPFASQVIELPGETGYSRRFNLLDTATLFVHLAAAEKIKVVVSGNAAARFRFEPFLLTRPEHYKAPAFKAAGEAWDLDAGFFVLTIEPERKGILEVELRSAGVLDKAREVLGVDTAVTAAPAVPAARFAAMALDSSCSYTLELNAQPGVTVGAIVRPLPLDVAAAPLPLALRPGESVDVRIAASEAGTLRADAEDGSLFELSLDAGPPGLKLPLAAGAHTARVRNAGKVTLWATLRLVPTSLADDTPLPPLPDALLAGLPAFPELTAGQPVFLDLDRGERATFKVRADRPALYRLESSGLLATAGTLRTRVVTSLDHQSANGVGRNFLLQQYLREGDYQLTVTPTGASKGHVGVSLVETPIDDGGELKEDTPARITLPAGRGVAYRFTIPEAGRYEVGSVGLDREFRCRLEDGDGWPIEPPGGTSLAERYFEAGSYRLVLLPEAVTTRRVTLLDRAKEPLRFTGHGPHALPLLASVEHVWLEPDEGAERTPDQWCFELPAQADVKIELTGEMEGLVFPATGPRETPLATVRPGRVWQGELPAGKLVLETRCSRRNNRAQYTVTVRPTELLAGLKRAVKAPDSIPLAVGRTGFVELSSFGAWDVRAELLDGDGRRLAASDDRPDDWGFLVAAQLAPGRYTLRVEPVGTDTAECDVAMRMPGDVAESELAVPGRRELSTGADTHVVPLPAHLGGVLLAWAHSDESVGVALELAEGSSWRTLGAEVGHTPHVAVPLAEAGSSGASQLRLRVWSVDGRGLPATVEVRAVQPREVSEAALAAGVAFSGGELLQAVRVALEKPGVLRLEGGAAVRWSGAALSACRDADNGLVLPGSRSLWLVVERDAIQARATVVARRVVLGEGEQNLELEEGASASCDLPGQAERLVLVTSSSLIGQPGVSVVGADEGAVSAGVPVMGVAPGAAAAVRALRGSAQVRAWHAGGTQGPIVVRLRQTAFGLPVPDEAASGVLSGMVPAHRLRSFLLPAGAKKLRLALAADLVAALGASGRIASVHWGGKGAVTEEVVTTAERLYVASVAATESPFRVEILPVSGGVGEVTTTSPLELSTGHGGSLAIGVDGRPGWTLHVRGALGAMLLGEDGLVRQGLDLSCPGRGELRVQEGTGAMLAWLDEPGKEGAVLWSGPGGSESDLTVPALVELHGAAASFRVNAPEPAVLSVRAAVPAVVRMQGADGAGEITVHPHGVHLDLVVGQGALQLGMRGLGGRDLSGDLEVTGTPVEAIGEGLGPKVLLPPGGARGFSFTLPEMRELGLGVRAAGPGVEATLLDADGKHLGTGVVLMRRLPAGRYVLMITNPEDGKTVVAQPAVAGLELPGDGPPEDVIRHYLRLAKGELDEEQQGETQQWRQPGRHPRAQAAEEDTGEPETEGESEGEGTTNPDEGSN